MAENFQRIGSISNPHVGRHFEQLAMAALAERGIHVVKNFPVEVGIYRKIRKKSHFFDLGSKEPPVLVECKSHKWTSSGNVPSAKMTGWNEAMYYFYCSPRKYRKIFFVLRHERPKTKETLTHYYIRTYPHLIPKDVEIWEYDEPRQSCEIVYCQAKTKLKRLSQTAKIHDVTSPIDAQWDAMQ